MSFISYEQLTTELCNFLHIKFNSFTKLYKENCNSVFNQIAGDVNWFWSALKANEEELCLNIHINTQNYWFWAGAVENSDTIYALRYGYSDYMNFFSFLAKPFFLEIIRVNILSNWGNYFVHLFEDANFVKRSCWNSVKKKS